MRSVTHQEPPSLQLLKTFLDALAPRGEQAGAGEGNAPAEQQKSTQPPVREPPAKTRPGAQPSSGRPASAAADAVAAQLLATLMTEGNVASGHMPESSRDGEGPRESGASLARREEPALPQPQLAIGDGAVPWPTEALAAYSARPRDLNGLQPGVPPSGGGLSGRSGWGPDPSTMKLFRKALICAFAVAVVFILLNRGALFG